MMRVLGFLLAIGCLSTIAAPAEARDGCGRGLYFNGYRCAPERGGYYARRYYAPPPYYEGRYYGPPFPQVGANGSISCGNPNYTYQNGRCRPYRGP